MWDLENGRELRTITGHKDSVCAVGVTPNGQRAVTSSHDNTLKVWDLESGRELYTLNDHASWMETVAITPDGRRTVLGNRSTLQVWDLETGNLLHTLGGHPGGVRDVALMADGQRAVSVSDEGTLKVWDIESGAPLADLVFDAALSCIAVAGDGKTVITGDAAGNVHCLRYYGPTGIPKQ